MGWQRGTALAARDYGLGLRDAAEDALEGWHHRDAIEHEWSRKDVIGEARELAGQFSRLWEVPVTDAWVAGACDQILELVKAKIAEWKEEIEDEDEE